MEWMTFLAVLGVGLAALGTFMTAIWLGDLVEDATGSYGLGAATYFVVMIVVAAFVVALVS